MDGLFPQLFSLALLLGVGWKRTALTRISLDRRGVLVLEQKSSRSTKRYVGGAGFRDAMIAGISARRWLYGKTRRGVVRRRFQRDNR
jgi:hypothetical protein